MLRDVAGRRGAPRGAAGRMDHPENQPGAAFSWIPLIDALTIQGSHSTVDSMSSVIFTTPLGTLHQGDCLEILSKENEETVDLVFADPPFNLSKDYGKGVNDNLADEHYLSWCASWIEECVRLLKQGGAFYIFNIPRWNVELGHSLNQAGMLFRHWITIDIKYSLPIPGRLYPSHYSLLYYTKGKPKTFTRPRVPIPVCRHCGGDIKAAKVGMVLSF
jgi:site-specific DNA-methyltransferase (adenine-specific)